MTSISNFLRVFMIIVPMTIIGAAWLVYMAA